MLASVPACAQPSIVAALKRSGDADEAMLGLVSTLWIVPTSDPALGSGGHLLADAQGRHHGSTERPHPGPARERYRRARSPVVDSREHYPYRSAEAADDDRAGRARGRRLRGPVGGGAGRGGRAQVARGSRRRSEHRHLRLRVWPSSARRHGRRSWSSRSLRQPAQARLHPARLPAAHARRASRSATPRSRSCSSRPGPWPRSGRPPSSGRKPMSQAFAVGSQSRW